MIKAVIYDLDNCLFSAKDIPAEIFKPVQKVIRESNFTSGTLDEQTLETVLEECWRTSFDEVAETYSLPDHMIRAVSEACTRIQVKEPLRPYPDLGVIMDLSGLRFLVTTGYRRFQESKIQALGLEDIFDATFIDALDDPERKGKFRIFEFILTSNELRPADVVVVGDNSASEIAAGNALEMTTVQILRPKVQRGENADFYIESLNQLPSIINNLVR